MFLIKRLKEESASEIDPLAFGSNIILKDLVNAPAKDLKETGIQQPKKIKLAGISDIRLFGMDKKASEFMAPPDAFMAKGIKIKIKDLQDADPLTMKAYAGVNFTNLEVGV